jgi:membrane-bound serine protease (ClpP class)
MMQSRLWKCLFVLTLNAILALTAFAEEPRIPGIPVVQIRDAIHIGTREYLSRALLEAKKNQAPALLIEIDTPGGFLDATREIVQLLLNSEIPIITWVNPQGAHAASAGSMIVMASHFAVMSPSTSIGAATPVTLGGQQNTLSEEMKNKVTNDTLSFVEGIADKQGRNREWAKDSVLKAASITADEALKLNVIDSVVSDRQLIWPAFLASQKIQKTFSQIRFPSEVSYVELPLNLKEKALSLLSNPNIAYGLLALGGLGIYLELSHPGTMIPGTIGVLSLALGGITMNMIPIRPGAVALLIAGLVLLAIELLTAIPTYGVAGVGGVVSLLLSGLFLLDPSQTDLRLSGSLWLPIFATITIFLGFLAWQTGRAFRSKQPEGMQKWIGTSVTLKKRFENEGGQVFLNGELWTVVAAPGATLPQEGDDVVIEKVEGLKLIVRSESKKRGN